jgi:hypothetical protein
VELAEVARRRRPRVAHFLLDFPTACWKKDGQIIQFMKKPLHATQTCPKYT